jgi:hypothetical protein
MKKDVIMKSGIEPFLEKKTNFRKKIEMLNKKRRGVSLVSIFIYIFMAGYLANQIAIKINNSDIAPLVSNIENDFVQFQVLSDQVYLLDNDYSKFIGLGVLMDLEITVDERFTRNIYVDDTLTTGYTTGNINKLNSYALNYEPNIKFQYFVASDDPKALNLFIDMSALNLERRVILEKKLTDALIKKVGPDLVDAEATPGDRTVGDKVFAGSLSSPNDDGYIMVTIG